MLWSYLLFSLVTRLYGTPKNWKVTPNVLCPSAVSFLFICIYFQGFMGILGFTKNERKWIVDEKLEGMRNFFVYFAVWYSSLQDKNVAFKMEGRLVFCNLSIFLIVINNVRKRVPWIIPWIITLALSVARLYCFQCGNFMEITNMHWNGEAQWQCELIKVK